MEKKGLPKINIEKLLMPIFRSIFSILKEIVYGIVKKTIPWNFCFSIGSLVGLVILFRWDEKLLAKASFAFLYPSNPKLELIYRCVGLSFGFFIWVCFELYRKRAIANDLTDACLNSGLKNLRGKLPKIVFDLPIDKATRKLRLTRANLSKEQFESAKSKIESGLNIYIDEMRENREGGTIDIIYSQSEISRAFNLTSILNRSNFKFMIGKTRAQEIEATLSDVPHLLIAGQSGGGKSTFLRQLITTIYLNNENLEMTLIDLKGGLEFQLFENLKRVSVVSNLGGALRSLEKVAKSLEKRMELLKLNKCKDIEAFQKMEPTDKQYPPDWKADDFKRHLVVIDEAYDLFRVSAGIQVKDVQRSRIASNSIAQKGRAVGVHIVIATQRPDKNAVDPQTKANLPGRLCFQMANNVSSMTVLDNGRATDLPKIAGRAIWQTGLDCLEVQTPNLTVEEAETLLLPHRTEEKKEKCAPKKSPRKIVEEIEFDETIKE